VQGDKQVQELLALYGCDELLPKRWLLRCGPMSCELTGSRLGPICVNGHEVWHGLAFLLRDAGWGTPLSVLEVVLNRTRAQDFHLELQGHIACSPEDVCGASAEGARLDLHLTLQGTAQGQLHLQARATATHDLLANRCGWVLMHPMSAAGSAVEIEHVDGRTCRSTFPREVPAWPPFMGVRTVRHEYTPGHWAEAVLPGEDYEIEDQRNNADASFKTYSRSNMMPRPYVLRRGQTLVREIHLRLLGSPAPAKADHADAARAPAWTLQASDTPAMRLGMAITADMARAPSPQDLALLRRWRPTFLHLTLWPDMQPSDMDWSGVRSLLDACGATLRLDLCGYDPLGQGTAQDAACRELARRLHQAGLDLSEIAAFPCGPQAAAWLRQCFAGARIGGGTPHFFAQLNRLENSGGEDFMAFTVCPLVHSADDRDIMNGLQSLPSMMHTARRRHPGRQWHLGPDSLAARASPLGRQPATDGQRRIPLAQRDPRTHGLFGAAWLLGHVSAALQSGVQALTLPPLSGTGGLVQHTGHGWLPTPTCAWLEVFWGWSGVQVLHADGFDPGSGCFATWPLVALTGHSPHGQQVLVANLGAQARTFHWPHGGRWACLDAQSWVPNRPDPSHSPWRDSGPCVGECVLGPYALARIDLFHPVEAEHAPRH
jgi:hypothetical protein